jgi:cytochrome c553
MMVMRWRGASRSIALVSLLFATLHGGAAFAGESGGLQDKIEYCQICHGQAGQGYRGYEIMPRLAGQQPAYLESQLRDYAAGRRVNSVMANVARSVPPAMIGAIAAHFRAMNPPPLAGGASGNASLGRTIFANGLPEENVPACSACHGPDGHGTGQIPRLAGQVPSYLVKTMSNWSRERAQASAGGLAAIMVPTTHNLSEAEIAAVAAYVGSLR